MADTVHRSQGNVGNRDLEVILLVEATSPAYVRGPAVL